MAEALLPAIAGGLLCSFLLERLLVPRPCLPWQRSFAALAIHTGLWLMVFGPSLLLWQRPFFTTFNVLALQLLIIVVGNAKYRALREPFIFQDFEYFTDALRHPRLYLPFFGVWLALACAVGYGLIVAAGLWLEPALTQMPSLSWKTLLLYAALLAVVGLLLALIGGRTLAPATFDAQSDLQRFGLLAMLWSYARSEREAIDGMLAAAPFAHATHEGVHDSLPSGIAAPPAMLPDLVVIQSESFFDARRFYSHIRADVLAQFDALRHTGFAHGRLQVAAWGANTVRTEFAFLSGLLGTQIGVHRFNPYRVLARSGVPTLATFLRGLGYRTVCVHPYAGTFYQRNTILPLLGFDDFLDIAAFGGAEKFGPYISDAAVAEKVAGLLHTSRDQPLYIHVITMENHGPLHWETVSDADRMRLMRQPLPAGCDDLVAYARHLANADRMFADIADVLRNGERPGGLCILGDHVPIMPGVYRAMGEPDGTTDYLLWSSEGSGKQNVSDWRADQLGMLFLQRMGLHR